MGFGSGEQDSSGAAGDRASASAHAVAPSAAAANAGKASSRRTRALGVAAAGLLALGVVWRLGGSAAESTHGALVGGRQAASPPTSDEAARLIGGLLRDAESTWTQLLVPEGHTYTKPKLVLFDDVAEAACGHTGSLVGPFYCPGDRRLYLDLTFLSELSRRLGPAGDFAQAYVVAHELGHHVQNLLGAPDRLHELRSRVNEAEAGQLPARAELQADCYAGVWAHYASQRRLIEPGDVAQALATAGAVCTERGRHLGAAALGPETWDGSVAQRVLWFDIGMRSGRIAACDTFANGAP